MPDRHDAVTRHRVRRSVAASAALLAAFGILCSCAAVPPVGRRGPVTSIRPTAPSGLSKPGPTTTPTTIAIPFGPLRQQERPGPHDAVLPWRLVRVDDAHRRVYLSVSATRCVVPTGRVAVAEDADSVTIWALGAGGGEPCVMNMVTIPGYVTLDRPLGDRLLEHGS